MDTPQAQFLVAGACITHKGAVREHNEDACLFGAAYSNTSLPEPEESSIAGNENWIIATADGIGGQNAGEIASAMVVEGLSRASRITPELVSQELIELNRKVHEAAASNPEYSGMGATVAGLCQGPDALFAFNVGDARLYRKQDDYLCQITKDDSIAQVLIDAGKLDPQDTRDKKLHTITQSIGGQHELKDIEPHIYPIKVKQSASFLICTDGLTDMVSLDDMEEIVKKEETPEQVVRGLHQAAMDAGGEDNITIIWAEAQLARDNSLS